MAKQVRINVQVEASLKKQLQEIAKQKHIGFSNYIRLVFLDHLSKQQSSQEQAA